MTPDDMAAIHACAERETRPWPAQDIARTLASPGCFMRADGQSFLIGRAIAGEAELLLIATHPDAQRRGHARSLLSQFTAKAQAEGVETAFLEVAASNTPARRLYESCGWAEAGLRRAYYARSDGNREDAVIYQFSIASTEK